MGLRLVPVSLADANGFVAMWHRHHQPVPGHKFSVGVADDDDVLRGVAIVGRPVARHFDDGMTLEVNRTATDGTKNANSMLYGAAARVTFGLGYRRLITYTQDGESGSSLREVRAYAATLDGAERRCVKCGGSDLWTNWHRTRWDCSYSDSRHGDPSQWNELTGEHLHRGCRRCHFTWRDPVLIPLPDKET